MCQDTNQFLELLKAEYSDALKYCRALCSRSSIDDAEDVLQQSFLQALENFSSLKDDFKFKSWFFKIITRVFYSSVRKHFWKKFLPLDDESAIPEMPGVFENPEMNAEGEALYKALGKLSSKERAAILLFEIAEFSIEEIKAIQNERSISAVKSRLSRVRAKLRKYLTEPSNKRLQPLVKKDNQSNGASIGDLEYETIKLITEIRAEK